MVSDKRLFVGDIRPMNSVSVRGINGESLVEGIGTVRFRISDAEEEEHEITLENVLYLPNTSKNLISISQWSEDREDDCGIMTRGEHSLFLWDHD